MVQTVRRRRLTTALIVIPCVLSIITLLSVWILPPSTVTNLLDHFTSDPGSPTTNQLVSNPKISHPNHGKAEERSSSDSNNNSNSNSTAVATTTNDTQSTALATSNKKKDTWTMVSQELLDLGVYESSDFVNEKGIKPTGWEHPNGDPNVWGPCRFVPKHQGPSSAASLEWSDRRRRPADSNNTSMSPDYYRNADLDDFEYMRKPTSSLYPSDKGKNKSKMGGWCRPGFLIIGAGKCGTSSLYHYLIGHPRVLPAIEKQIHYFKYHDRAKPLAWYYGHFPTPQSFLEHGGLVTGEASPGYLPYPGVARDAYKAWKGRLGTTGAGIGSDGKPLAQFLASPSYKSMVPEVPPRIIALGREPLDRIYSSYKYNYVVPTIEYLRTKGHPRIPAAKKKSNSKSKSKSNDDKFELNREDDEYYLPYLFTLEDFVRAELKQLQGCLYDWGPEKTYNTWNRDATYNEAVTQRNRKGDPATSQNNSSVVPQPLIDLDGICYGKEVSKTVYRQQWSEMQTNNPKKVLLNKNLHLTQAFIGRSLYVFPLEWWYLNFRPDPEDSSTANTITFVCTEDLNKVETLNDLTEKLGLPKHDGFVEILNEGAYNVGGHRGYDTATSWEEIEVEKATNVTATQDASEEEKVDSTSDIPMTNGIPLPEDLYLELKEFINPINERLFALTGKRCDW